MIIAAARVAELGESPATIDFIATEGIKLPQPPLKEIDGVGAATVLDELARTNRQLGNAPLAPPKLLTRDVGGDVKLSTRTASRILAVGIHGTGDNPCASLTFTSIRAHADSIPMRAVISAEISAKFHKRPETFAELYIKHDVKAPLIGWHPSTVNEGSRNSNDHVLDLATRFPNAFLGILASLDTGAENLDAVARYAQELVRNAKVLGFKFHPPDQGFYPNDRKFYPIWEVLQASGKPVMFHVGFTVLGANTDGGSGIALDYGRPIHLDTLARDFPRMKIIAAHPGWPWEQELIGVVTHKKIYSSTLPAISPNNCRKFSSRQSAAASGQGALRHRFSIR